MNEKIRVVVTQEDIDNGKPSSHCECAVAVALNRQHPSEHGWFVRPKRVSHLYSRPKRSFALPPEAENFINDFDKLIKVKPFEFEMEEE